MKRTSLYPPMRTDQRLRPARGLIAAALVLTGVPTALATNPAEADAAALQPLTQRSITVGGLTRDYWLYVPEDFAEYRLRDPKNTPMVMVVHPDGSDAKDYAESTAWAQLAEERNFVAVFPSAGDGSWTETDLGYLRSVTSAARSEWRSSELFTYAVGEGTGAAMANTLAATSADQFVAVASLGGAAPRTLWNDTEAGLDRTHMAAWQVLVGGQSDADETRQVQYWKDLNGVSGPAQVDPGLGQGYTDIYAKPGNALAQVRVSRTPDVAALRGRLVAETIYDQMFRPTMRFANQDSTLGNLTPFRTTDELGLQEFRGSFGSYERRWYVYTPPGYAARAAKGEKLPVVVVYHGRNGSYRYVAQQTRWIDVARDRGFIAVFAQADVAPGTTPFVNVGFSGSMTADNPDVAMTLGFLDDIENRFAVDTRRVFLAGVSQGAAFTNRMAVQFPDRFAGIAPCYSGHLGASGYQNADLVRRDVPMPVWQCRGSNELNSDFPGDETAGRTFWRETVNHHAGPPRIEKDGRYRTEVFEDGLADYRWTIVGDIGHFMAPDLAYKIWDEMFAHYQRETNGSLTDLRDLPASNPDPGPNQPQVLPTPPTSVVPGQPWTSGQPRVGKTLRARPGTWSAGSLLSYQWLADGEPLVGERSSSLVVRKEHLGARIAVRVTGTQEGLTSAAATSTQSRSVRKGQLRSSRPRIVGNASVGRTLRVKTGTWTKGVALRIVWLVNGNKINTGAKITLRPAQRNARIKVRVTGRLDGYQARVRTSAGLRVS